eukprot:g6322.t1
MIRFHPKGHVLPTRLPTHFANRIISRKAPKASLRSSWKSRKSQKISVAVSIKEEDSVPGLTAVLDSVKWSSGNLVPVIVQHVDTGEILMQAFADRAAICETMQTKLATFYSRSREARWCKGETSGNFINVLGVYLDCDRDSIIYIGDPVGPACHTGAISCWFSEIRLENGDTTVQELGSFSARDFAPKTTLYALEETIEKRKKADPVKGNGKPSWTVRLLEDPNLLCEKIREEAGELCETLEKNEGKQRAAEEMADLLFHSLVLLNKQGVTMKDVLKTLRGRFGTSGIEEKKSRSKKV